MNNPKDVTPVYIRVSDERRWVPALQFKSRNGKATVVVPKFNTEQEILSCSNQKKFHDSQVIQLKEYDNGVLPMQNVDSNDHIEDYKDMVDLPFMHEVRFFACCCCTADS